MAILFPFRCFTCPHRIINYRAYDILDLSEKRQVLQNSHNNARIATLARPVSRSVHKKEETPVGYRKNFALHHKQCVAACVLLIAKPTVLLEQ